MALKRMRDYSDEELQFMPQEKVRMVFPEEGHERAYIEMCGMDEAKISSHTFEERVARLGGLRACDCVAKFHVFPTSEDDVLENELLWSVVNQMKIDAVQTKRLLNKNVLVMSFPNALYEYLSICTPEEMKQSILDIVSDVVDHPDSVATGAMLENLAPSVFEDLNEYVSRRRTGEIEPLKQTFLLDDILGHKFDQFSSAKEVDLWNIDVRGGYLTDTDLTELISNNFESMENIPPQTVANRAYHRLYNDWCTYRSFGYNLQGRYERLFLTEAVMSNITGRKQEEIATSIRCVRKFAKQRKSLFNTLPTDLIEVVVRNIAADTKVDRTFPLLTVDGTEGVITRSNTIRDFFTDDDNNTLHISCCSGCHHKTEEDDRTEIIP